MLIFDNWIAPNQLARWCSHPADGPIISADQRIWEVRASNDGQEPGFFRARRNSDHVEIEHSPRVRIAYKDGETIIGDMSVWIAMDDKQ